MAILEIQGITKIFGGLTALNKLDVNIDEGEIVGLVGPNGSGKTTWINIVSGFLKPTAGDMLYKGQSIVGLEPYQIAERGIIRTFQLTSLFSNLTARENIIAGRYLKTRHSNVGSFFRSIFLTRDYQKEEMRLNQKADEVLAIVEMEGKGDVIATNLPTVDQRKLGIAIALAGEPELLLLDEPAAGMNPEEVDRAMQLIQSLQQSGITLVVVEHNMKVITGICTHVVVINYGTKIAEGTAEEVINNEAVISSFLGEAL